MCTRHLARSYLVEKVHDGVTAAKACFFFEGFAREIWADGKVGVKVGEFGCQPVKPVSDLRNCHFFERKFDWRLQIAYRP